MSMKRIIAHKIFTAKRAATTIDVYLEDIRRYVNASNDAKEIREILEDERENEHPQLRLPKMSRELSAQIRKQAERRLGELQIESEMKNT